MQGRPQRLSRTRDLLVIATTLLLASTCVSTSRAEVPASVLQAERERIQVIETISKSTIAVFGVGDAGGGGSAVVISPDGYALTNFHVTKPVGNHLKCGLNDGVFYDAVIVAVDPTGDVALIKLLGRDDFPAAVLGDSDRTRAGDWCIVSGNPFLLATDFHPTITYGIVSGVHRYQYPAGTLLEYADCLQTDAAINPGNSGGPLWDASGRLIGINGRGSFEKRGRVNVGVGYAISINQIKKFLGYLKSGRIVDHATLGATVATDDDGRVVVTNILSGSDAYRRGLRYGDEIVSFGGRAITSANGFKNTLGTFPKGWRVPLSFVQDNKRIDTHVRLAGVHRSEELLAKLQLGGIAPPQPKERPKPDPPKAPPGQDDDEEDIPAPAPIRNPHELPGGADKKLDPKIAKLFAARRGYSNYYFNQLERDRVWSAFQTTTNLTSAKSAWQLTGSLQDDQPFEIMLDDRIAEGRINKVFESVEFNGELSEELAPRGSGGLLLALHQWRRFVTQGPQKFGDVFYLGTAPLPGREGVFDVIVGTFDTLESRLYFDPASGRLEVLELFPDLNVDPCELHFKAANSQLMPTVIEVVFGDDTIGTIRLEQISVQTSANTQEDL